MAPCGSEQGPGAFGARRPGLAILLLCCFVVGASCRAMGAREADRELQRAQDVLDGAVAFTTVAVYEGGEVSEYAWAVATCEARASDGQLRAFLRDMRSPYGRFYVLALLARRDPEVSRSLARYAEDLRRPSFTVLLNCETEAWPFDVVLASVGDGRFHETFVPDGIPPASGGLAEIRLPE